MTPIEIPITLREKYLQHNMTFLDEEDYIEAVNFVFDYKGQNNIVLYMASEISGKVLPKSNKWLKYKKYNLLISHPKDVQKYLLNTYGNAILDCTNQIDSQLGKAVIDALSFKEFSEMNDFVNGEIQNRVNARIMNSPEYQANQETKRRKFSNRPR